MRDRLLDLRTPVSLAASGVVALLAGWQVAQMGDLSQVVKLTLVGVAAIVAVLALEKPELALYGVLTAAALDRQVGFAGLHVGLTTLGLAMFAPALALMWSARLTPTAVKIGAGSLCAGGLIACATATDRPAAIIGTVNWVLVLNLILGGIGIIGRDERQLKVMATVVSVLGAVVGLLGLMQSKGIYTIVGPSYLPSRIDSSFGWYTNFANFEALAAVVAAGLFLRAVADHQRLVAWTAGICALVSGTSVVLSLSRGAVLLVASGAAVLLLMRFARPMALIGTAFLLSVAGLAAYVFTPTATRLDYISRFTDAQGGDAYRYQLQAAGAEVLRYAPLGIGFDNFRQLVQRGVVAADLALAHAHSLYVQVGLDAGWLGLFGFVMLMTAASLHGLRLGFSSGGLALQATFSAALIGFLIQGVNDYFFFETGSLVMFSVLVLGALAPTELLRSASSSREGQWAPGKPLPRALSRFVETASNQMEPPPAPPASALQVTSRKAVRGLPRHV